MNVFSYSLCIYFVYWLINYSGPVSFYFWSFANKLPDKLKYAISCVFCMTWWVSLAIVPFVGLSWWFILAAPVINLFINLLYLSLTQPS